MATQNTTVWIERLDGERLVLDGLGLARGFFLSDPSSIGISSFDSLTGRGEEGRITTADIQAIIGPCARAAATGGGSPSLTATLTG